MTETFSDTDVSVIFAAPVTGTELINAVLELAGTDYRFERAGMGVVIGRGSSYASQRLTLAPSPPHNTIVFPGSTYRAIKVMHRNWETTPTLDNSVIIADVIAALTQFAESLAAQLGGKVGGAKDAAESVWPQSIEVCADCQRFIKQLGNVPHCVNHGFWPKTITLEVVPAPKA